MKKSPHEKRGFYCGLDRKQKHSKQTTLRKRYKRERQKTKGGVRKIHAGAARGTAKSYWDLYS